MSRRTSLAATGLRSHARRLVAAGLAIAIGVAFVAASMMVLQAMRDGVRAQVSAGVADRDLVVVSDGPPIEPDAVDRVRQVPGVGEVTAMAVMAAQRGREGYVVGETLPASPTRLLEGRLPGEGEVAIGTLLASATGWQVGDTMSVRPYDASGTPTKTVTAPIVGIVDLSGDPAMVGLEGFVAPEQLLRSWPAYLSYPQVRLDLAPGADLETVRAALSQAIGIDGVTVRTGQEEADHQVAMMLGSTDYLGIILTGFGLVAMLTSALVIANTFTIVLAQRRQELAMLRCVGASRAQLQRAVTTEAVVLGAAASAVGVALGWAGALAMVAVLQRFGMADELGAVAPRLSASVVLVPWVAGILLTVAAAWWPTVRACAVPPVAALRPAESEVARARMPLGRVALAVGLLLPGAAALVWSARSHDVPIGVLGGLLSFVAVLVAAPAIVPRAVRLVGGLTRPFGVPSRLATDNAVRNPSRAAATSGALLVGVTLITMTSVGAATAAASANAEIDAKYAVDVTVTTDGGDAAVRLDRDAAEAILALPGVQAGVPVRGAMLRVVPVEGGADAWEISSQAFAVDPTAAAAVLRSDRGQSGMTPDAVGMSADLLSLYGIQQGVQVQVEGPDGTRTATVVRYAAGDSLVLHPDLMAQVAPKAPEVGLWLRLRDGADVSATLAGIRTTAQEHDLLVDGGAAMRGNTLEVLDTLVLVASGLLGVAVLIALVGIANTLSLSVIERVREHALLRGLGLTRGQLRGTLLLEGVLIAVVSALIGVLLGIGYAWFGVRALLPEQYGVQLAVPWARVALVLLVALVAGGLASVLPARRAARVVPAQGLVVP